MRTSGRRSMMAVGAALLLPGLMPGDATLASEWRWSATPYIWGAGINLDADVDGEPTFSGNASFEEILHKTDLALMGRFEGRRGKGGFFVDTLFLGVSDDKTHGARPPLPGGTETATDLDTWLAEAGGFWRPSGKEHGFDVLFGARLLDLDMSSDVAVPPPIAAETSFGMEKSYLDGFVGARWSAGFAKRWDVSVRADAGTGGTDLSWNAAVTFGVFFDDDGTYTLRFGYHHMAFDMEDDDRGVTVDADLVFSGPFAGFTFAWGRSS